MQYQRHEMCLVYCYLKVENAISKHFRKFYKLRCNKKNALKSNFYMRFLPSLLTKTCIACVRPEASKLRPATRCGPWSHFIRPAKPFCQWWKNNIQYLLKICWFARILHIPQQLQCARRLALDMFCITLWGPRTKKFGDPCFRPMVS